MNEQQWKRITTVLVVGCIVVWVAVIVVAVTKPVT